jgi:hypothetical protein
MTDAPRDRYGTPGRALDPGVGDHHVKVPEPVDGRVDGRLDLSGVGDIGHLPGGLRAEAGRARLKVRRGNAREEDARTLGDERTRRRHSDGALAAGNDRDLTH